MKGLERGVVNQADLRTVPKLMLGKRLRDELERIIMGFPSVKIPFLIELNCLNVQSSAYLLTPDLV